MTIQTQTPDTLARSGAIIEAPLNKLKPSPRNVRKVGHSQAAIEALAASIAAKGLLQAPVVEPELDAAGTPTGFYRVTIGEGRRLALALLARRKQIRKTEPVRCLLDLTNDPCEISLDENITRSDMHPADQFEAFRDLAERRGLSAEDIAARFGVGAQVVRQRLRLGAVSPKLMDLYRQDELTLDQLMAFAVSEDHERQEQVHDQLAFNRSPTQIRRAMTETKVAAHDRRARFIGVEAYAEAGGTILRDLFTEDGGGWFEDVGLLDQMVADKLKAIAAEVAQEGWKWAGGQADYPHGLGLGRIYPHKVEPSPERAAEIAALSAEYDALVDQWDGRETLPPEVEARFAALEAALERASQALAYDPEERQRAGVLVVLGHDGRARIERGLIRPEDAIPEPEAAGGEGARDPGAPDRPEPMAAGHGSGAEAQTEPDEPDGLAPLSERLIADLTAHRTLGLRSALGDAPDTALLALTHALALRTFFPGYDQPTCLEVKVVSAHLEVHAPQIEDSPAGRRVAERHAAWASRLPQASAEVWDVLAGLSATDLMELLAHCAARTVNAVCAPLDRRPAAIAHADQLATALDLDMTRTWTPTQASYLGRITKARILEAVSEGVSEEAAERISGLKKAEMAEAAETLLAGTGWLPPWLRTIGPEPTADAVTGVAEPEARAVSAAA